MAVASKKKKSAGAKPRNVVAQARSGGHSGARRTTAREWLRTIIGAVLIFVAVRTFLIEAYHIPSGSMEPTLLVGDFLFANKLVFGPHVPFTHYNLPGFRDPRRGEVVVYESPSQAHLTEGRIPGELTPTVVKRLVGTPGDTLYMRNGMLYVNGIAQRQGYGVGEKPFDFVDSADPNFDWQKPYGLTASRFGAAPANPTHDNWGPLVVPTRHYFSLGDNRYNSIDARYYGFIPRQNIRAKPVIIYMSFDFDDLRVRWNRIGKLIH